MDRSAGLKISNQELLTQNAAIRSGRRYDRLGLASRFRADSEYRSESNRFASCVNQAENSCSTAKLSLPAVSCSWQQHSTSAAAQTPNPKPPNHQSRASYKNGFWRACSVSCRFETETRACAAIEFDQVFGFQIGFFRRFGQVLNHLE